MKTKKTFAQEFGITNNPFFNIEINNREIHFKYTGRTKNGYWWKAQYDENGECIFFENAKGEFNGKRVEIDSPIIIIDFNH
jgi:hypothetical protein